MSKQPVKKNYVPRGCTSLNVSLQDGVAGVNDILFSDWSINKENACNHGNVQANTVA